MKSNLKEKLKEQQKKTEMPDFEYDNVKWDYSDISEMFPKELTLKIERKDITGETNTSLFPLSAPCILGEDRRKAIEAINSGKGMKIPVILHEYEWGNDEPVAARILSGVQEISIFCETRDRQNYIRTGLFGSISIPFYFVHLITSVELLVNEWNFDIREEEVICTNGKEKINLSANIWDIDIIGASLRARYKAAKNFYHTKLNSEDIPFLRKLEGKAIGWFNVRENERTVYQEDKTESRPWRESPRQYDAPSTKVVSDRMPYGTQHLSIDLTALAFIDRCREKETTE